jgi:hypothetical protein
VTAPQLRAATFDEDTLIADAELSRRFQMFSAWCGVAFVILLFGGWGIMGGFIPLISAADSPAEIAAALAQNPVLHKVGLSLGMIGITLTLPFYLVISVQMRRAEPRQPLMSALQLICGIIITAVLLIPMLIFIVTAFRPERSPELSQMLNDMSYIMLILPWPPIIGQIAAIVITTLRRRPAVQVFPRWVGFFTLWVGVLLLPANMIIFFRDGLMAWTGLIGFWIPAAAFGIWYPIMTWALLRAIRQQYESGDPD